jgi:dephospho-CoA kinase
MVATNSPPPVFPSSRHRLMKTLGLTGGIGSGKSAAALAFANLGAFVVSADEEAKRLMQEDPELRAALAEAFGEETYTAEGTLDRAYLAGRVFGDPEAVARLNAIVHPRVRATFPGLVARAEAAHAPLLVYEAALLVEAGYLDRFDAIAVVDAPVEMRIARVMARDDAPREAILARIRHQLDPAELLSHADYVITNDGDLDHLHRQVERVFEEMTA